MDFKSRQIIVMLMMVLNLVENLQSADPSLSDHHKLLLVTIDALKASYYDELVKMPGFKYVTENGVRGKYLKPAFPSLTSPCHTTIATGLYPESHGVVHNCYYDIINNSTSKYDYLDTLAVNEWWDNDQEPIWITAVNQGLKSGGYMFPGSNATINGKSATRSILQTLSTTFDETSWKGRIDDVMSWFTDDHFDFIALYFEQPDTDSHRTGPESDYVYQRTLPGIDRIVQYLLKRVNDYNLADDLNIILTSDHGMLNINVSATGDDTVSIMKYINPDWVKFQLCNGPIGLIEPVPEYKTAVYEGLKAGSNHMDVYYKEDLPDRFHYKLNDRVPSIVVLAKYGYNVYGYFPGVHIKMGEHGHDNDIVDMRTSYYSIGPDFKKGYTLDGFESVNIYPLMCHLLGLKPAPNNGSLSVLSESLRSETSAVTFGSGTTASLMLSVPIAIFVAKRYFQNN